MNKQSFFKGLVQEHYYCRFRQFIYRSVSQMVFPVVPLFLLSLGASAWVVGLVEGAAETTASLLKVFSGYWSDKIKRRKPFVFAGYGLSSLTKPLFAFAQTWPFVLFFRVVERVGKGIRDAPRDAIVAESVDVSIRGKAYGFQRAMDGIGSFSGAILASFFAFFASSNPLVGYRRSVSHRILSRYYRGVVHPVHQRKTRTNRDTRSIRTPFRVSMKRLPRNLQIFILVSTIFALANFGYAFLILKAKYTWFFRQYHASSLCLILYCLYLIYHPCRDAL